MNIFKTSIEGLLIIEPTVFGDSRGYFMESFSQRKFLDIIGDINFVQENESKSKYGVIRGLHFQNEPYSQSKLVRVVKGRVLDVVVDIRPESPTYGHHLAIELSEENKQQLFIPKGFAHGFSVLSSEAIFQYKCDNYYNPESEGAIIWNDPQLNIDWKIPEKDIILSEKDQTNNMFCALLNK